MIYDLEHKRLPPHLQKQRIETFLSLVRMAQSMNTHWNVNVQSGLKDLMQMLGYTDVDKLLGEVPFKDPSMKFRLQTYLRMLK